MSCLMVAVGCNAEGPLALVDESPAHDWSAAIPSLLFGQGIGELLDTDGDRLYVTDGDSLVAYDAEDGSVVWRLDPFSDCCGFFTRIRHSDGVLYAGHTDRLLALEPATGSVMWSSEFDHITDTPFVIDESRIYAPGRGTITAISKVDGAVLWAVELEDVLPAGIHLTGGEDRVCFGVNRWPGFGESVGPGTAGCIAKPTGDILWRVTSTEIETRSSPAIIGNRLILGSAGGSAFSTTRAIYAFDVDDGTLAWKIDPGMQPLRDVVSVGGRAVSCLGEGLGDGRLEIDPPCVALDPSDGSITWQTVLTRLDSDPVIERGRVFILDSGDVVELHPPSGGFDRVVESSAGEPFVSPPVLSGNRLFVLTSDSVHAYRLP